MNDEKNLKSQIEALPRGNLTKKVIGGKTRLYLQWREGDKVKSRYVKEADVCDLIGQISLRERLEERLAEMQMAKAEALIEGVKAKKVAEPAVPYRAYETNVVTGAALKRMCKQVKGLQKREGFRTIENYLKYNYYGRVCVLFGLRRTGKTTMMLQTIAQLPPTKTAYIKIMARDEMDPLERDLQRLSDRGVEYIFIDEVTLLEDFIDCASLFSDIYAMQGFKVFLSGTDSLGFPMAMSDTLFGRALTVHTTFIPFREYARLLNIHDVDEYICYGGTLQMGKPLDSSNPIEEECEPVFATRDTTAEYVDTAIAQNIQHSLEYYQSGYHFRHLEELYLAKELTSAINRIVEDMNHRFLLDVLTRDFKSNDLQLNIKNLRRDPKRKLTKEQLNQINFAKVIERLKKTLGIKDIADQKVKVEEWHVSNVYDYLDRLELIAKITVENVQKRRSEEQVLVTQPGLRYAQAQALVQSILQDEYFATLEDDEKKDLVDRILNDVKGRILEEMVLFETLRTRGKSCKIFKLQFDIGEFDMVVSDRAAKTCEIFEIKHSDKIISNQYRHLMDASMCQWLEKHYYKIVQKTVLYRGPNDDSQPVRYRNVAEYLEGLG